MDIRIIPFVEVETVSVTEKDVRQHLRECDMCPELAATRIAERFGGRDVKWQPDEPGIEVVREVARKMLAEFAEAVG